MAACFLTVIWQDMLVNVTNASFTPIYAVAGWRIA